ncbi:hypothetical protein OsJ_25086 [Oryza sativa Japonica Group]|uniref:Phorbol-ester/DAG-type domain-containing protein n=1 Tax=Oryza sativa subsp. japonica TaxID=39947 RepID=B9FYD3_ORYSJ|nr:hypothetical protein OsJ_25086 [Oryza sativa Japonica Group]
MCPELSILNTTSIEPRNEGGLVLKDNFVSMIPQASATENEEAASGNQLTESRTHFAHPQHPLLKTQYGGGERQPSSRHVCRICGTRVVAGAGYRCDHCDFDIHEACADFFPEKMITPPPNFFGHPWSHNLALRQVTAADGSWPCTLCRGALPARPPRLPLRRAEAVTSPSAPAFSTTANVVRC